MKWMEWRCPDCPDWGCGADNETAVAEGKRLHQRTVHDGLTFRQALSEGVEPESDLLGGNRDLGTYEPCTIGGCHLPIEPGSSLYCAYHAAHMDVL